MRKPTTPQIAIEASVTQRTPKMEGLRASLVQREDTYQPIIAPSMKTSPWAKLMSFKTPYTIV